MQAPTDHRPWPLPSRPWVMTMTWEQLLFAHWPVAPELLRPLVPAALPLDTFGGNAWVGVVPFAMTHVRPRGVPPLPWLSRFLELNVRTYVTLGGKPGVFFFSLDAANPIAVRAARLCYHLPYFDARMRLTLEGERVLYESSRTHRGAPPAELRATYRPIGPAARALPGTIDDWLTARYCLYAVDRNGGVHRGEIHHAPWPLQPAEADLEHDSMAAAAGIALAGPPTLLHFARRLVVRAWWLERVRP